MSFDKNIIGNEKIIDMLQKSYNSGKLSHAYLFEGSEHIGKKTFALEFCKLVFGDSVNDINKNPDLIILHPDEDKKQITIEQIRELEKKINLYPYSSKYKIVIIEKADMMTKAAANAVLKTLEEPSKTTILILLTSNSNNLLDTIKSRCQIMKFLPVQRKVLEAFIKNTIQDEIQINRLMEISEHKPGKVVELIENSNKVKDIFNEIDNFSEIFNKNDSEKLEQAEIVSRKDPEEIVDLLNCYSFYLRKKLLKELENQNNIDRKNVIKITNSINSINILRENILTKNINVRLAFENLFLKI